ncbi:bifunctional DNA primase/polymerase [Streptomyces olivoreticuli]
MTDHDQRLALKDAALAAAGRGWRVFPLRPGGTEPAVRDWRSRATTDPERIARAWDTGPYNVGIAVCASGLVVLDLAAAAPGERPPLPYRRLQGVVDGADVLALHVENEEARWPTETFTVAGPGGMHLYFAHPAGRPCPPATVGADGALGWHVAVRAAESFVPAVGSITRQGAFRLVHDAPPMTWPDWLDRPLAAQRPRQGGCDTVQEPSPASGHTA